MTCTIGTRCRSRCWWTGEFGGAQRKLMYFANRNGFFYVLDRTSGEFLLGKKYVKVTWGGQDR